MKFHDKHLNVIPKDKAETLVLAIKHGNGNITGDYINYHDVPMQSLVTLNAKSVSLEESQTYESCCIKSLNHSSEIDRHVQKIRLYLKAVEDNPGLPAYNDSADCWLVYADQMQQSRDRGARLYGHVISGEVLFTLSPSKWLANALVERKNNLLGTEPDYNVYYDVFRHSNLSVSEKELKDYATIKVDAIIGTLDQGDSGRSI